METREFTAGAHSYEVKMFSDGGRDTAYEIWREGKLMGERNRWPIVDKADDAGERRLLTRDELFVQKQEMYMEQEERNRAANP
jgi:hypothetical protein